MAGLFFFFPACVWSQDSCHFVVKRSSVARNALAWRITTIAPPVGQLEAGRVSQWGQPFDVPWVEQWFDNHVNAARQQQPESVAVAPALGPCSLMGQLRIRRFSPGHAKVIPAGRHQRCFMEAAR